MPATVAENTAQRRFELPIASDAIAAAYYRIDEGRVSLIHTEVPFEHSGQGFATQLAAGTFDLIRASGRKVLLKCPFMGAFYRDHPEYGDIVAG